MINLTKTYQTILLSAFPLVFAACGEKETRAEHGRDAADMKAVQKAVAPWTHTSRRENITEAEIEENSKLQIITETQEDLDLKELRKRIVPLIESGDFTALDEMAASLLESKEKDTDGGWKLVDFYTIFELSDNDQTHYWKNREDFFKAWIGEKPESLTARIALAAFYRNYAWRARGSGWADSVTEEGWRLMGERLELGGQTLGSAMEELEINDPMFYQTAMGIMLGIGGPPSTFDGLVAGSLEIAPDYWGTLSYRAYTLLPRWLGEPGDWENFAKYIADENKPYGTEQYARIVLGRHSFSPDTVDLARLDWDLLKEGIRELLKNYPDSVTNISRAAFIATSAEDRDFAKECFDLLGDRCVPSVWKVNGRMCHYRNWALTGKW